LVGDIEILYIPKIVNGIDMDDLFRRQKTVNATDKLLDEWVRCEKITKRLKGDGTCTWGEEIKLARTVASGMPVDFFAANRANWWNLMVCRTGSASSNMRITSGALKMGWKWRPYSVGFSRLDESTGREQWHKVHSEEDAFHFVGLPCLMPQRRT
jgi:DNA polymerase/3'-5' exonuclease PolX